MDSPRRPTASSVATSSVFSDRHSVQNIFVTSGSVSEAFPAMHACAQFTDGENSTTMKVFVRDILLLIVEPGKFRGTS
jgi:hypothetical protein